MTQSAAVANKTRCPAWQARIRQSDREVGLAGAGWAQERPGIGVIVALRCRGAPGHEVEQARGPGAVVNRQGGDLQLAKTGA